MISIIQSRAKMANGSLCRYAVTRRPAITVVVSTVRPPVVVGLCAVSLPPLHCHTSASDDGLRLCRYRLQPPDPLRNAYAVASPTRRPQPPAALPFAPTEDVRPGWSSFFAACHQHTLVTELPRALLNLAKRAAVNNVKRPSRFGQEHGYLFALRSEQQARPARREVA